MANRIKNVNGINVELTDAEEAQRDAEEKAWADGASDRELDWLRQVRNDMLSETDWMGNSDVTMNDEWKTYRQELRDITKKFKSMNDKDFKFPDKPKS